MYTITQDKTEIEGVVKTTYGIQCDGMIVGDVSPNKEEVIRLIDKLNKYELSECHLRDAVEDFIAD